MAVGAGDLARPYDLDVCDERFCSAAGGQKAGVLAADHPSLRLLRADELEGAESLRAHILPAPAERKDLAVRLGAAAALVRPQWRHIERFEVLVVALENVFRRLDARPLQHR